MKNDLKDILGGLLIIVFLIVAITSLIFMLYGLSSPESKEFMQLIGYAIIFITVIFFLLYISSKIHKTIGFFMMESSSICVLLVHNNIIAFVLFMIGFLIITMGYETKQKG